MLTSDNELLSLYVKTGDEVAFRQLIERHAAMVLGVCQGLLGRKEDAEDAFQAVFLLLSVKAKKLLSHNSVGGWLHESAVRTSLNLRAKIIRKREVAMSVEPLTESNEPWRTITACREQELLHREISRLPKRYREVIVLCHLEGKSRSQAASVLDCTTASVKASLARGRKMLRVRLLRHGVAASVALGAVVAAKPAVAQTYSALIESTLHHCQGLAPELGVGTSPEIVQSLVQTELSTMTLGISQSSLIGATCVMAICAFSVIALAGQQTPDSDRPNTVELELPDITNPDRSYKLDSNDAPEKKYRLLPAGSKLPPKVDLTAKTEHETWVQYVSRLKKDGVISDEDLANWNAGDKVDVQRTITITRVRKENRTREVPETKIVVVKQDDGTEKEIPNVEIVTRNYEVSVPYFEKVDVQLTIPRKGSKPEAATNPGFVEMHRQLAEQLNNAREKKEKEGLLTKMLSFKPRQADANFDTPKLEEGLKLVLLSELNERGWEMQDNKGVVYRKFLDFNADKHLDTWVYFKDGVERYREIDFDFDKKVDQYQYTDGDSIRYGIDEDQDGQIDRWESDEK